MHRRQGCHLSGDAFKLRLGRSIFLALAGINALAPIAAPAAEEEVRLAAPAEGTRFDPAEFRIEVAAPSSTNPFTEVEVSGEFRPEGAGAALNVDGFCDSRDGSVHRLRFSPPEVGAHAYTIRYRSPRGERTFTGSLMVQEGGGAGAGGGWAGPVVADPAHPRKLIRAGNGRPFFHLGTTAYHLLDPTRPDEEIDRAIDQWAGQGFNKIRFLLTGYPRDPPDARPPPRKAGDGEEGVLDWAQLPNYGARPGKVNALPAWEGKPHAYDFSRFNTDHWRRADRAVRRMRERGMIATAILTIEKQDLPKEYGALTEAEFRLYRYAVARLAAFDNIWWDLGNEHNEYRSVKWGETMGRFVREHDPYHRLASAHAYDKFLYPASEWAGFIIVQQYGGPREVRDWALRHRAVARPFVNEEYGYEGRRQSRDLPGHGAGADETRRRHWAIAFGGGYATYGDGVDGAWYYEGQPGPGLAAGVLRHLRTFCESIPFNEMEPRDELLAVPSSAFVLAGAGRIAVYLPDGGPATLGIPPGEIERREWFDPRTGERSPAEPATAAAGEVEFRSIGPADRALDLKVSTAQR